MLAIPSNLNPSQGKVLQQNMENNIITAKDIFPQRTLKHKFKLTTYSRQPPAVGSQA